jgi:2-desacetyl-2-hydroxyethyl bacteriochlorophyllide A dehydrogenase
VSVGTRVVFPERGRIELEEFDVPDPGPAQVVVRARFSLISSGTERTVLHGRYDAGTHWESYGRYPFFPGYSAVGAVEAVGDEVSEFAVGDVVAVRGGHASHVVSDAVGCTRVPAGVDLQQATWFAFAKIARMGAQVAEYGLGARVLTVGAGMIGQMSVRWANAAGAQSNVVVDPVPARLVLAERGGATATTSASVSDRDAVLAACDGVQPDYVVDATGNAAVFSAALQLVAFRGRVVVVGNTGSPSEQRLTDDVINRCLTIVGAHDILSMVQSPWDGDRGLQEHFFQLVRTGRFDLDGLVTDVFTPSEADAAYRALDERPAETLGVGFDWT